MHIQQLKALKDKRPFQPFRLLMANGCTHDIYDSDLLFVAQSIVGVTEKSGNKRVSAKAFLYDPERILGFEMLAEKS